MAKKVDHISLKKSTVAGKIPSSDVLVDGELAVNIAEGGEKIFLRNTAKNIVEFSSDKLLDKKYLSTTSGGTVTGDTTFTKDVKVVFPNSETPTSLVGAIVSNEKVTSAALNNLNEKVNDHKSDIDNLKAQKNLPLSGGTVTGEATFSGGLKFRYPDVSSTPVSLRDVIADNEEVTAAALNDLNDKINKIGDISIANGLLIINDGNTKYKLNLEQLVTDGYATKE